MDTREVYMEKAQAKMDELSARIDLLRAQAKDAAADAKLNLSGQASVLETVQESLRSRISQMKNAGEDAVETVGKGLEAAIHDVEDALEKAEDRLERAR